MSAPARGRGGGMSSRGTTSTPRGQTSSQRGNATSTRRARGRGRIGLASGTPTGNHAGGLLQKLRTGTTHQSNDNSSAPSVRGQNSAARRRFGASARARGSISRTFNASQNTPTEPALTSRTSSPAPPLSHRDFVAQMSDKYNSLKPQRDAERKRAIQDGFLSDPEKKTSLANAITPVGTCTEMCPQFERVERIVQNMVDKAEKVSNDAMGRDMPSEDRMVKRFRRSAAGYDEQLPSDIRTPETLRKTLDYLLDKVIGGGERLASIHKFVWDRTRGIRNDFSIQQVTRQDHVSIAVDCYERIARFHILSLHQLSNPDNLQEGEHFDSHQEREQLNNTLLSLMYYYDDNRGKISLPNEPEFRSYCILFELRTLHPDLEDRMQSWPVELLVHPKVQTAFRLHTAAGNTISGQGPLQPLTPSFVAQANSGKFWTILSSQEVSYIMACVAEINFGMVRFVALNALWRSGKSAPQGQRAKNQEWTLGELQNYLAFDSEDQTLEFCEAFDLVFKYNDHGEQYLDFTATSSTVLKGTSIPSQQVFSHEIVEEKRYRRNLVAVINGIGVAAAIRQGLVVEVAENNDGEDHRMDYDDDQSMFIPEQSVEGPRNPSAPFSTALNPSAAVFEPSSIFGASGTLPLPNQNSQPTSSQIFGSSLRTSASNQGSSFNATLGSLESAKPLFQTLGGAIGSSQDTATQHTQAPTQTVSRPGLFGLGNQRSFSFGPAAADTSAPSMNSLQSVAKSAADVGNNSSSSTFSFGTFQPSPQQTAQTVLPSFDAISKTPTVLSSNMGQVTQQPQQTGENFHQTGPSTSTLFGAKLSQQQELQNDQTIDPNPSASPSHTPGFSFGPRTSLADSAGIQPLASVTSTFSTPAVPTEGQQAVPLFNFAPLLKPVDPVQPSSEAASGTSIPTAINPNHQQGLFPSTPSKQFASGKQDVSEKQIQSFSSLSALEPSTTPQQTSKRPQLGISQKADVDLKPTPPGPPPQTQGQGFMKFDSAGSSTRQPVKPASASPDQLSLLPEAEKPPKPKFSDTDRKELIENTSRLILTQPHGLMEYFVSHHVSNLLQSVVRKHLQEQHDNIIGYVRTSHLLRKFYAIWKERVQTKILKRRAKQRRKLLAAAMQAEQDKKQRNEAELEEILAATRESKRIQEEQKGSRNRNTTQQAETLLMQETQTSIPQMAGRKRKTASQTENAQSTSGTPQRPWSTHKRSRTVDNTSRSHEPSRITDSHDSFRASSSTSGGSLFSRSVLNKSSSSVSVRRSPSQKVDSTKTDYFKLKAMGIDPDTPLVPDTAKTLVERRKKEQEDRQALLSRSRTRPSVLSASTTSRQSSPLMQPPSKPVQTVPHGSLSKPAAPLAISGPSIVPPEDDDFLRQLREARRSLAHDADWFKSQTSILEQEIEKQQELRRSRNSQSASRQGSPRSSINGFSSTNGHEYYAIEPKVGRTLSRTEERIRRTGAHGLATRPVERDYVPVAMSRRSALKYSYGAADETSLAGKKRMRDDEGATHTQAASRPPGRVDARPVSGVTHATTKPMSNKASHNAFAALQQDEDEDEELDADGEFDHDHGNGVEGDTEDNDDDLLDDDDDEEEAEVSDENDDDDQGAVHHYVLPNGLPAEERVYDDEDDEEDGEEPTPGTYPQFSRAQSGSSTGVQSGPGASADDALVLSD